MVDFGSPTDRKLQLFELTIVIVFVYLLFKPMELLSFNNYLPIYLISIPVSIWFLRGLWINSKSRAALLIFISLAVLTLIGVLSTFVSSSINRTVLFTWPAWFCVMSLGVYLAANSRDVSLFLPKLFKYLLLLEALIAAIQLFYPDTFTLLWSSDKTRGIEHGVRVTGSLYNPNFFALVITFFTVGIVTNDGVKKNIPWSLLGYSLVLLSGSRTLIIGMPLVLITMFYLNAGRVTPSMVAKGATLTAGMFMYAYIVLNSLDGVFRYAGQLVYALEGANLELESIQSYTSRQRIWYENFTLLFERDFLNVLIGIHDTASIYNNPHQNFIYVIKSYGLAGLLVHIMMLTAILSMSYNIRHTYQGRLLYLTVILMLGYGLTETSFANMTLGIFFAFTLGLVLHYVSSELNEKKPWIETSTT